MTNPDSLQAICAELRHPNACIGCAELADRLERLDAEMRKEVESLKGDDYRASLSRLRTRRRIWHA